MIYHIYANQTNIGDWLSAKGIQSVLKTDDLVECFCDIPFIEETIRKLNNATSKDLIVIGGGGLLMDYFIPFWQEFKPISERIPFCIWGIGVCDVKHEKTLPPSGLIENILSRSRLNIVRDKISRDFLKKLSIPEPVQCPSTILINPSYHGTDILHVVNYTTVGEKAYYEMSRVAKNYANSNNITYRETNNIIPKSSIKDLEKVLHLYEQSKIIISSALHGCIIGASMNKKIIAVSGDNKIEGFMQEINLDSWVINYTDIKHIEDHLNLLAEQADYSEAINKIRKQNEIVADQVMGILKML